MIINFETIRNQKMVNEAFNGDYIIKENDLFEEETPWLLPSLNKLKVPSFKRTGFETELFGVYTKNKRHHQTDKILLSFLMPGTEVEVAAHNQIDEHSHVLTKDHFIRTILSFKTLVNNWDGYGAIPLELDSASNSIKIITLASDFMVSKIEDLYPNPNGTVSILWKNRNDETVSVEIGNNSMSYYVMQKDKDPEFFDNVPIDSSSVEKLSSFVRLL